MTDYSVKRSYRGEVLVAPPGGDPVFGEWVRSKNGKDYFRADPACGAVPYGRTSKAGQHLKGGGDGLANWKGAMAAIGAVMSPTVQSEIATLLNEYHGDPYYKGDDGGWRSGKKRLLDVVDRACEVAGSNSAAAKGTEFHKLGEMVNKGQVPHVVRPELLQPLDVYRESVARLEFLHQEMLIVHDELELCGSADYLLRVPAGTPGPDGTPLPEPWVVVGDLKTGKHDANYPAGLYAQLAGYGTGMLYDQETNERGTLHPELNPEWGVLVHFPLAVEHATVKFYWVDLHVGLRAAQLNRQIDKMLKFFGSASGKPVEFSL